MSTSMQTTAANPDTAGSSSQASDSVGGAVRQGLNERRAVVFINIAHFVDHFILLIFPTAVLTMGAAFGADYGERIALATGSFLAFGLLSLPAGWLGDRWSRHGMMAVFYLGSGVALILTGLSWSAWSLAAALTLVGLFASIYHPVGMAMLVSIAGAHGRVLAWNGIFGNLGVALAAITTGALVHFAGWRAAFVAPGVICLGLGVAYLWLVPRVLKGIDSPLRGRGGQSSRRALWVVAFALTVTVMAGGFTFNTATVAMPQLVAERLPELAINPVQIGLLATMIYLVGAVTQLLVGRVIDRMRLGAVFLGLAALQLAGFAVAARLDGVVALAGAAMVLAAVYGQVIVNDLIIARSVPDAWRARAYAVRYLLGFAVSASAVPLISVLHDPTTGLRPVYTLMIWFAAAIFLASMVYWLAAQADQRAVAAAAAE